MESILVKRNTWFIFWQEKERPPASSLHWHHGTSPGPGQWTSSPRSLDLIFDPSPGPWLLLGRSNLGICGEETWSRRKKARMEDMGKDGVLVTLGGIMAHLCYLKQINVLMKYFLKHPLQKLILNFSRSHVLFFRDLYFPIFIIKFNRGQSSTYSTN